MKKKELNIYFSAGVKYRGVYYLAATCMNALFSYNENENKLTFLTSFKKEKKKHRLYYKAFLYKNEAWFIPYQADHIAIVNLERKTIEYMTLMYHKEYRRTSLKYINFLCFERDYICLVPQDVDAAMLIDLKNKRAKGYYDIVKYDMTYPYHSIVFKNEKIYFFPWNEKKILVLDLKTDERNYLSWYGGKGVIRDTIYDKKTGYLFHSSATDNYILIDDFYGNIYKKINFGNWNDKEYKICYASRSGLNLFFWGHEKNIIVKINVDNFKTKIYSVEHNSVGIYFFPISSNDIEALVFEGNCIIKYDKEKDKFLKIYMSTTSEKLIEEIENSDVTLGNVIEPSKKDIIKEDNQFELQLLIFYASYKKMLKPYHKKNSIGSKIYKCL